MKTIQEESIWNKMCLILGVLLLCLLIRVCWIFLVAPHIPYALGGACGEAPDPSIMMSCDFIAEYNPIARNLLESREFSVTKGIPTAQVPPLYPFFLSLVYCVFGESPSTIRLVQILLDILSCFIVIRTAEKIFDKKVGILSGVLFSIYPIMFYQTGLLGTETLFVVLFLGSFYFLVRTFNSGNFYAALCSGILMGFATLCRPIPLVIPPFILIGLLYIYRSRIRLALAIFFVFLLPMYIVISPWIVRNYAIFDEFIPVTDLYRALDEREAYKHLCDESQIKTYLRQKVKRQEQIRNERFLMHFILDKLRALCENPFKFIRNRSEKFYKMWFSTQTGNWQMHLMLLQFTTMLLALLGLVMSWRHRYNSLPVFLVVSYWTIILSVVDAPERVRYLVPIIPFLLIYVAYCIAWLYQKVYQNQFSV